MKYDDALCKLVIQNMAIVEEAPKVVEEVQKSLFAAINQRIQERVAKYADWEGVYELLTGENEETCFTPLEWPKDEDGNFWAYYQVGDENGEGHEWLACALGVQNAALCLQFFVEPEVGGVTKAANKKRLQEFYAATPTLKNMNFLYDKEGYIYLPFALDADVLAAEFPDFDKALEPLDKALDALFSVHNVFDEFVKAL